MSEGRTRIAALRGARQRETGRDFSGLGRLASGAARAGCPKPEVRSPRSYGFAASANALAAAFTVASTSSSECASETKAASNCEGGK